MHEFGCDVRDLHSVAYYTHLTAVHVPQHAITEFILPTVQDQLLSTPWSVLNCSQWLLIECNNNANMHNAHTFAGLQLYDTASLYR
jgi:hypothetical protein